MLSDEEIRAACHVGIVTAAARFDPARGVLFATYVVLFMRREVQVETHKARRFRPVTEYGKCVSGNAALPSDDNELFSILAEAGVTPLDQAEAADFAAAVRSRIDDVLRRLDQRLARIVRMRFGIGQPEPMTLDAIAPRLGISRERVRQLETQAMQRIAIPLRLALADLVA